VLRPVKDLFQGQSFPNLLVGLDDPDDAAVWRLDQDRALVVTTDFFTPVVDDPYEYGAIAAANSLSDVYAMGGQPFLALNILALPPKLPPEIGAEILRGGAEVAIQAGIALAGGHTIQDEEPKYGLVVLGFVHPERIISKRGARPGDVLVLTKPLGFGVTTTALKQQKAAPEDVAEVVGWMKRLNQTASDLALEFGVRGGTDITGFSLLGHAAEMAQASNVALEFYFDRIPLVSGAQKYAQAWTFPGGASDNRAYFIDQVQFIGDWEEWEQMLLFDPQTSGGLLLCLAQDQVDSFLKKAQDHDLAAWQIGRVVDGEGIVVHT
jgi:selenide,water dikinase